MTLLRAVISLKNNFHNPQVLTQSASIYLLPARNQIVCGKWNCAHTQEVIQDLNFPPKQCQLLPKASRLQQFFPLLKPVTRRWNAEEIAVQPQVRSTANYIFICLFTETIRQKTRGLKILTIFFSYRLISSFGS